MASLVIGTITCIRSPMLGQTPELATLRTGLSPPLLLNAGVRMFVAYTCV